MLDSVKNGLGLMQECYVDEKILCSKQLRIEDRLAYYIRIISAYTFTKS